MADVQDKQNEEVFEEGEPKEARTVHRMRANSTIMQVNKILVANRGEIREFEITRSFWSRPFAIFKLDPANIACA